MAQWCVEGPQFGPELGFCLCGVLKILLMSTWVDVCTPVSFNLTKDTSSWISYAKLPQSVYVCMVS